MHAVPIGLAPEAARQQALGLRPVARELAVGGGPHPDAVAELPLDPGRDADERRDRDVRAALAEQRALELGVGAVERGVVPVEAAARLRHADQEVDEDGTEERVVLGRAAARVRTRVDACRRLAGELVERDRRILPAAKPVGPRLDEVAHERPVLVERRAGRAAVLLECKRKRVALVLELAQEVRERAEHEPTQRVVELRRANGHALRYAPAGANPRSDGLARRAGDLAARAPVRRAVPVAQAARCDRRPAARAGTPRASVDRPIGPCARHGASHRRPAPRERRRKSSSSTSPTRAHGERRPCQSSSASHMFPIPATSRWSRSASPSTRAGSAALTRAATAAGSVASASRSGPRRRSVPFARRSTEPFQSRASSSAPRSTSHGRPCGGDPAGTTRQRPVMPRWLWTTTPPSKWRSRFLPRGSTVSSTRPSTARATALPRGCGADASTPARQAHRACRRHGGCCRPLAPPKRRADRDVP